MHLKWGRRSRCWWNCLFCFPVQFCVFHVMFLRSPTSVWAPLLPDVFHLLLISSTCVQSFPAVCTCLSFLESGSHYVCFFFLFWISKISHLFLYLYFFCFTFNFISIFPIPAMGFCCIFSISITPNKGRSINSCWQPADSVIKLLYSQFIQLRFKTSRLTLLAQNLLLNV